VAAVVDGTGTATERLNLVTVDELHDQSPLAGIAPAFGLGVLAHAVAFLELAAFFRRSSEDGAPFRYARTRKRRLSLVGGSLIFGRTTPLTAQPSTPRALLPD
jgi:hypothetical protein